MRSALIKLSVWGCSELQCGAPRILAEGHSLDGLTVREQSARQ